MTNKKSTQCERPANTTAAAMNAWICPLVRDAPRRYAALRRRRASANPARPRQTSTIDDGSGIASIREMLKSTAGCGLVTLNANSRLVAVEKGAVVLNVAYGISTVNGVPDSGTITVRVAGPPGPVTVIRRSIDDMPGAASTLSK
jgi:hypothetical protein